ARILPGTLEEPAEERGCFRRNPDDLVRCLPIELEVQLGLGSTVLPFGKALELVPPQAPPRSRGAPDDDADARRLPGDPAPLRDRAGRSDDPPRDQASSAFVLACEYEDHVALGDPLAPVHRLLF